MPFVPPIKYSPNLQTIRVEGKMGEDIRKTSFELCMEKLCHLLLYCETTAATLYIVHTSG
jgi:hypothetical protein